MSTAPNATTLTPDDLAFVSQHALDWARTSGTRDLAYTYQAWYLQTYGPAAETMAAFPSHPSAWRRFLRERS